MTEKGVYIPAAPNTVSIKSFEEAVKKIGQSCGEVLMPKITAPALVA